MLLTRLRGCRGEKNCTRCTRVAVYSVEPEYARTVSQCANLPKVLNLREVYDSATGGGAQLLLQVRGVRLSPPLR